MGAVPGSRFLSKFTGRRLVCQVAAVVGLALLAQPAVALGSSTATAKEPEPVVLVSERPDAVSAMVTARAQGSRVENTAARTEFTTQFANPDGTWTLQRHSGQQRYRDEKGAFSPVDLSMVRNPDGSVGPRRHPAGLRLSGKTTGAAEEVVSVSAGKDRGVSLGWSKRLPAPVLEGTRARYVDLAPGVDMVIDARRSGFEQTFEVKTRPVGPMSWDVPLRTRGLTASVDADGAVLFTHEAGKNKGELAYRIPPGIAWDAVVDPNTGDHPNTAPVAFFITQKGKGRAVLTVTPQAEWLTSPDRVLPIVVDPAYAAMTLEPSFDTYVQQGVSSDQSSSSDLKIGNNGEGQVARSFLKFPGSLDGKKIISAELNVYANHAWSCSKRAWEVWDTSSADSSTKWSDQPSWNSKAGSDDETKGYSGSCPNGWTDVDITALVRDDWADGTSSNTIGLRAANESDAYGWKKFDSSETSNDPYVAITYDRAPSQASAPGVTPVAAYAPPGGASAWYTSDATPSLFANAGDPDQNMVRMTFEVHNSSTATAATLQASCTTAYVAPGANATCAPATALADGGTYWVRAKSFDGYLSAVAWSPWTSFKTARTIPAAPSVSCPAPYGNGTWAENPPGSLVTCTITATGSGTNAPGYIRYSIDGAVEQTVKITQSTSASVAKINVSVSAGNGGHHVRARAQSPSGLLSGYTDYRFGYGPVGLSAPKANPPSATTSTVAVAAGGPPKATGSVKPTAALKWRLAGEADPAAGWTDAGSAAPLTVTDLGAGGVSVSGRWNAAASIAVTAGMSDRVPARLETRVCLTYTNATACTGTGPEQVGRVQYLPHAFGNAFPTAEAGPGQVALWTGEFQTEETDVAVPGYTGELSISRSHSTYAGVPSPTQAVFGPGWIANLDGPDAGIAGWQVIDNTHLDATLALIDPEGSALVYGPASWARRTGGALPSGAYEPADEDTDLAGAKLAVTGTGTGTTITFTEDDGTVTVFTATTAPTTGAAARFAPASVTEPGANGQTTFSRDAAGRITRIIAPTPPGVTCSPATDVNVALLTPGCRSLRLLYGTTTGGGEVTGQVKSIYLDIFDPQAGGGTGTGASVEVARYSYDSAKRLIKVTDPRSGLGTDYAYDGDSFRIAAITPAGLMPYQVNYADRDQRKVLDNITRARPAGDPAGGSATLASIRYGVDTSGPGLPDLSAAGVAVWNQAKVPSYGAAVFGPEHPAPGAPGETDWAFAELFYTDELGYTLNTASFGAGAWQLTATDYDAKGNIVREWDEAALADIRALRQQNPQQNVDAAQYATQTVYNTEVTDGAGKVLTPAGTLVTDQYGPARWAMLTDGTYAWVRPHTATSYDQGAPDSGINTVTGLPYRLPTTVKATAEDPGSGGELDTLSLTRTGYDALGGVSGWALGIPTTSTIDMPDGEADIIRTTGYDAEGRIVETRQPSAAAGEVGTRVTSYYTAGSSPVSGCGNKPEWAGLICQVAPGDGAGSVLPTERTIGYSYLLAPTRVEEISGGTTRTTTTSYLPDGRVKDVRTSASGLSGSAPVKGTRSSYDPATGLAIELIELDANGNATTVKQATGYDAWGRTTSYTSSGGGTTTTSYDPAGRVATVTDPKGSTTWAYDGVGTNGLDAAGNTERRGLPTSVTVSNPGGPEVVFTGAYNADGQMATQIMPGGITQHATYDNVGELTGLSYTGQVNTETGSEPNGTWLAWSARHDVAGRTAREFTPLGSAFTDAADGGTGDAIAYDRAYRYDRAGRLITVKDRTATTTGTVLTPDSPASTGAACQTRTYDFDTNGNRTGLTRHGAEIDGSCATNGTGDVTTWAYSNADRLTSGANGTGNYLYDNLGRATTIPAVDTRRGPAGSNLTIGYYDTDAVQSLTQDGVTTTYNLDAAGRRLTATTDGPEVKTLTWYYTDGSDSPGWVEEAAGDQSAITRYAGSLGGDLAAEITGRGEVSLRLANPHGDTVTTVQIPENGAATGITAWADYDEYGNPLNPTAVDTVGGATGYGWLGAKERATHDTGLLLMGARLYNPTTAQFTSIDPVYGGNETAYAYPGDPVNMYDLDGQWGMPKFVKKAASFVNKHKVTIGLTAASFFVPGAGAAALYTYRAYRLVQAARASSGAVMYGVRAQRLTSRIAGRMWVGRGAKSFSTNEGKKGWQSADGLRKYRAAEKKGYGGVRSNFERRNSPNGKFRNNYHVVHKGKHRK